MLWSHFKVEGAHTLFSSKLSNLALLVFLFLSSFFFLFFIVSSFRLGLNPQPSQIPDLQYWNAPLIYSISSQTRSAQNACDMDSKHKHHAHELDAKMQKLRNTSSEIGLFPNIEKIDNTWAPDQSKYPTMRGRIWIIFVNWSIPIVFLV